MTLTATTALLTPLYAPSVRVLNDMTHVAEPVDAPVGTLNVALQHAARLLNTDPASAAAQAAEILKAVAHEPNATLLLGVAQRLSGAFSDSVAALKELTTRQPNWAVAHFELAQSLGRASQGDAAIVALRRAVALKPDLPAAWLALADHLNGIGEGTAADAAYGQHVKYSTRDPRLLDAAAALLDNRIPHAEMRLREHLKLHPTDVAAIRMMAEVAARIGRYGDAENLLARCLTLAPSFVAARHNYAVVLHRQYKSTEALTEVNRLLQGDARNPGYRNLKAAILGRIGEYAESIALFAEVLAEYPNQAKVWMSYGHALKTAGRQDESIAAYKRSIELAPQLGEAWWSLANLKTVRFSDSETATMLAQLKRTDLGDEDRFHFDFTLGKAFEDAKRYAESFTHYERGNALRAKGVHYDVADNTRQMERARQIFSAPLFAARRDMGCPAPDPIFIVGLPRSGSTLLEQILASHPLVEGTMELPDIADIVRDLTNGKIPRNGELATNDVISHPYATAIQGLSAQQLRELGERYLTQTRVQRKTNAPYFIDKMPNNFAHIGLIHLILPNAKIIDARRHPLGCCFSGFKQHFARGQHFTYGLDRIGRYYRDYVALMAHFDSVLPGRVHRVIYEALVDNVESEVRRVLDYCQLPFDERCLRFYENDRAVRTASSEQVRQPIYREGVDQWRNYEQWLGPLKDALGDVLLAYPGVPQFADK
jgi:tetratricopeptide (TPR) repeat protein